MDRQTRRVLRNRDAARYLGGVTVSAFGDAAMSLAAGIWVKELTGSNGLAALVTFCYWLPGFAGPAIGTLADRVRRRPLLVAVHLLLATVLLLPLAVRSADEVWLLFLVLTLVGTGAVLSDAAEVAVVTAVVPDELRGDLNGLARTAVESAKLLAPLAGAGLFTTLGGHAVALLDAATFLLAAVAFALLRIRETTPPPRRRSWRHEVRTGVRYLRRHRLLRGMTLAGAAAMTAASLSSTALFALLDGLRQPAAFAGVLTAVQGLGSVVGGLGAGALLRRMPERTFAALGVAVFALGLLARATPWTPVVCGGSLLIGLGLPLPLIAALTAVQRETPGELTARVAATAHTVMFAPTGLGLLLGTGLVASLDYRVQVLLAAAVALAAAAGLVRGGRTSDERTSDGAREAKGGARTDHDRTGHRREDTSGTDEDEEETC
ncbi:MFS transporter [Streptomyces oceani]|uniref:MFS transporter n=1 Tax=Streptomyces oceani TaxID=1075402 RepID=UPI00087331E7|nr:MFS transporter [Streptomyces oceani]